MQKILSRIHFWLVLTKSVQQNVYTLARPQQEWVTCIYNFCIPHVYSWSRSPMYPVYTTFWNKMFSRKPFFSSVSPFHHKSKRFTLLYIKPISIMLSMQYMHALPGCPSYGLPLRLYSGYIIDKGWRWKGGKREDGRKGGSFSTNDVLNWAHFSPNPVDDSI